MLLADRALARWPTAFIPRRPRSASAMPGWERWPSRDKSSSTLPAITSSIGRHSAWAFGSPAIFTFLIRPSTLRISGGGGTFRCRHGFAITSTSRSAEIAAPDLPKRRNLMVTMLLGGLWHGASWRFVIWGGELHGIFLLGERVVYFLFGGTRLASLTVMRIAAAASRSGWCSSRWGLFPRQSDLGGARSHRESHVQGWTAEHATIVDPQQRWGTLLVVGGLLAAHWTLRNTTLEQAAAKIPWFVLAPMGAALAVAVVDSGRRACVHLLPVLSRKASNRWHRHVNRGCGFCSRWCCCRRSCASGLNSFGGSRVGTAHSAGDADLWCSARARVRDGDPNQIVFVGASRMQMDLEPGVMGRVLKCDAPVQLAVNGNSSLPTLEDLAQNPNFWRRRLSRPDPGPFLPYVGIRRGPAAGLRRSLEVAAVYLFVRARLGDPLSIKFCAAAPGQRHPGQQWQTLDPHSQTAGPGLCPGASRPLHRRRFRTGE